MSIARPLRATNHCRHYSHEPGLTGGPLCALGIDLSAPGTAIPCMPDAAGVCASRQDYTDEERATWKEYVAHRMVMLGEAVKAIGDPVKPGTQGSTTCPHCAGFLRWSRARNGHVWLQCSGPGCVGPVHFNVPADREWPLREGVPA